VAIGSLFASTLLYYPAALSLSPLVVVIEESLKGQEMLDTLLHELFHAGNWDIKEDAVEEFCTDAARILWNLGYRSVWDEEESRYICIAQTTE